MRNFRSNHNRLAAIEGQQGMDVIKLTFADGSTRGIKVAHDYQLQLFVDACEWARAYPPAPPEGIVLDPPPPEPKTPSDALIALLGEAVSVEGQNVRFLRTIHSLCRQTAERKQAKGQTLPPGNKGTETLHSPQSAHPEQTS